MKNDLNRRRVPGTALIRHFYERLGRYRSLDPAALSLLPGLVGGQFYPGRDALCPQHRVLGDLIYVADGYVASYALSRYGDRALSGLHGPGAIVATRSFLDQRPSAVEWQVTAGSYLLKLGRAQFELLSQRFPELLTALSLLLSEQLEAEQRRALCRNRPAAQRVAGFYREHPAFGTPGRPLPDSDIATYLGIGESTLRRERSKLWKP